MFSIMRGLFMAGVIFVLNVLEAVIKWALRLPRAQRPTPPEGLSPREQVLELERIREKRGYKPGWLYYRCQELGLEDTLRDLRHERTRS